ncbi:Proline-specific permease [Tolypocladium ophioglossoides CBS 100239]|uniref:Proline-specific permease n=1 Tax=Tolypocladium ophioglossoides (strain CBS 100239) TaxID=1163406 RepID=A0A0L0N9P1_TOLOC|nr:Proline-specific permease [Tolypocladium ophioglossoides CBS 100239]
MTVDLKSSLPAPARESEKGQDPELEAVHSCANGEFQPVERVGTKRNIRSRHAQMIAIGGSIGTGLFVGTGQALAVGGPGFLFLSYCLTSLLVYGIITAVIEISTYLPISGSSMAYYSGRYVSPSLGFALGWLYVYTFGVIVAYEITASSIVINFWPNNVPIAVWITILLIVVVGLNLSPVGVYAESEFWFAGLKIIMFAGLLILAIILILGGGPDHDRLGFRYWVNPGATNEYLVHGSGGRFTAFLYVWVFAGFSFYFGPELIVLTSGEMRNPRKNLPIASHRYFYRLAFFYVLGSLAIGAICSSNAKDIVSGAGNANASPWVVAIRNAGITVLPSIVNAGILTSAWSSGNSFLYMSSRTLYSLAVAGNAPKIFTRCNRYGLPIYAVLASSCFTLLAYLTVNSEAGVVFNWFISLTNTSGYTSWVICSFVLIRFRKACVAQGVKVPYQSKFQPYAAWVCIFAFLFLLLANGFTVFYPGHFKTSTFLTSYLGIPIFIILLLGHKFTVGRNQPWLYSPAEVNLTDGLREVEADAEMWARVDNTEREEGHQARKWWKKVSILWG